MCFISKCDVRKTVSLSSKTEVWLLRNVIEFFRSVNRLPTKGDILRYFCFHKEGPFNYEKYSKSNNSLFGKESYIYLCLTSYFWECGIPNNLIVPSPDTRTARQSTSFFDIKAGSIFPSQYTINGQFGSKDSCISLIATIQLLHLAFIIDSLLIARAKELCLIESAAAMLCTTFLSLILILSNVAAFPRLTTLVDGLCFG